MNIILSLGVIAGMIFSFPSLSFAKSCAETRSIEAEYEWAAAAFTGKVQDISPTESGGFNVRFRVLTVWKGTIAEEVVVYTGHGGGDGGFPFEADSEYLVYASAYEGRLSTNICSRTALLAQAGEDIARLEMIREP